MLASMYSAVAGLSAHQTKMNVIGNNISNVNTYGFKSSRATFSDVFYQTMRGASAPTATGGGTNASQLGYGARVNSVDVIHTRAGSATTGRAMDIYINGDGFIPVKDSNGLVKYTRVGILSFDQGGSLVDSNGNKVLGFPLDPDTGQPQLNDDGTTNTSSLIPIQINPAEKDEYTGISIGPKGEITAIKGGKPQFTAGQAGWISGAGAMDPESKLTGGVNVKGVTIDPDSIFGGAKDVTATGTFTALDVRGDMSLSYDGTDYWINYKNKNGDKQTPVKATVTPNGTDNDVAVTIGGTALTFKIADTTALPAKDSSLVLGTVMPTKVDMVITTFNKAGKEVELAGSCALGAPAADGTVDMVFTSTTGGITETLTLKINAKKLGAMSNTALNGLTAAANSQIGNIGPGDGIPVKVGQIATANFTNVDGLLQDGQNYFVQSSNSGTAVVTVPGTGTTGSLRSESVEMSNVDLSKEFTEMIITQRGFQANTRMITVSDEMLSELVAMKR